MLVLEERGNRSSWRKPQGAEQRTNKLNPHMTPDRESNLGHIGGNKYLVLSNELIKVELPP